MDLRLGPTFNEFRCEKEAPCGIVLDDSHLGLCEALADFENKQGRVCESMFLFGGMFTSLMRGEVPNDYDVVICNPDIVKLARQAESLKHKNAGSYSEMEEIQAERDVLLNKLAPYNPSISFNLDSMTPVHTSDWLGDVFQICIGICTEEFSGTLDVTFCDKQVDGATLLSLLTYAPIRSIGYSVDEGEFIYHKKFSAHADQWKYEPFATKEPKPSELVKVRNKGMVIVFDPKPQS